MKGNPNEVLRKLKDAGYHIEVEHVRISEEEADRERASREDRVQDVDLWGARGIELSPKGGYTYVTISENLADWGPGILKTVATGMAMCSPYDAFNKNLGLRIALGRALHGSARLRGAIGYDV